jgi:hypothetical protein
MSNEIKDLQAIAKAMRAPKCVQIQALEARSESAG